MRFLLFDQGMHNIAWMSSVDALCKVRKGKPWAKFSRANCLDGFIYKTSRLCLLRFPAAVMESRDLVSVSRTVFWSLGLESLVSVSKHFGLELLVSRLCMSFFFLNFCKKELPKKRFSKTIVQNSAVQRCQWLSFFCCYVICEMKETNCSLPGLQFLMNSINNVYVPMKPKRIIFATIQRNNSSNDSFYWIHSTIHPKQKVSYNCGIFCLQVVNSNSYTRDQNQLTVWYFWLTHCQQIEKAFITKLLRNTEKCFFDSKVTSLEQTRKDFAEMIFAMSGKRNVFALVLRSITVILVAVCLLWEFNCSN